MKKSTIQIAIVIFCCLAINSCSKLKQCQKCTTIPPDHIVSLKYNSSVGKIEFNGAMVWKSGDGVHNEYVDAVMKNSQYLKLNERINFLTSEAKQTFGVVVYANKLVSTDSSFSDENIMALSRFSKADNMIRHDFYQRDDDGKFKKINPMCFDISIITTNAIDFILNNVVLPGEHGNSMILLIDRDKFFDNNKNPVDILLRKSKSYAIKYRNFSLRLPDVPTKCKNPCSTTQEGNTCTTTVNPITGLYERICSTTITCGSNQMRNELITSGGMTMDSIHNSHDSSLHYGLRDNILSNSVFGEKYISHYYDLSGIYKDKYNLSLILNTTRVLFEFNSSLRKLLDPQSNSNEIFLTSGSKTTILNLINDFKVRYNDNYTESVFQDIINDINWAENKTIAQVRTRF